MHTGLLLPVLKHRKHHADDLPRGLLLPRCNKLCYCKRLPCGYIWLWRNFIHGIFLLWLVQCGLLSRCSELHVHLQSVHCRLLLPHPNGRLHAELLRCWLLLSRRHGRAAAIPLRGRYMVCGWNNFYKPSFLHCLCRGQLPRNGQQLVYGEPVPAGLLLPFVFQRHHAERLPCWLLLSRGYGHRNAKHLLPRRLLQWWWYVVSNASKLHRLWCGLLLGDGEHHVKLKSLHGGLLLRHRIHRHNAKRLPFRQLLPRGLCCSNAVSCWHIFGWWYILCGADELRCVLKHGLLPCHGRLHFNLKPLRCGLLLHQLLWWHSAGAVPRGLLVRCRPERRDYKRLPIQLLLTGRLLGYHIGRLRRLRHWHEQHAGLFILHASDACVLGGLRRHTSEWFRWE